VKDKRFKSGWAFFGFRGEGPARAAADSTATSATRTTAVDTTFVQFYPTLLPREARNPQRAYLAEEKAR
jgi:hypothetical protein